jgi:hypothetical protein
MVWATAWLCTGAWAPAQPLAAAKPKPDRAVVRLGELQAAVVKQLGQPTSTVHGNGRTFLMYPEGRIILENDRVVELPLALQAPLVAPKPPAPPPVEEEPPAPPPLPAPGAVVAQALAAASATSTPPPVSAPAAAPAPVKPEDKFQVPMWASAIIGIMVVVGGFKVWDRFWAHVAARKHVHTVEAPKAPPPGQPGPPVRDSKTLPPVPTNAQAFQAPRDAPGDAGFKLRPRAPRTTKPGIADVAPMKYSGETKPPRNWKLSRKEDEEDEAEEKPGS